MNTNSKDGVSISYQVTGKGLPALVFVHGWCCDKSYWDPQVRYFAADHQVITVDLAGHGFCFCIVFNSITMIHSNQFARHFKFLCLNLESLSTFVQGYKNIKLYTCNNKWYKVKCNSFIHICILSFILFSSLRMLPFCFLSLFQWLDII